MKNLFITILFIIGPTLSCLHSQESVNSLFIHDTRYENDLPNFITQKIRADFKLDYTIGIPTLNHSTSLSIAPWADETGGFVHQLNFNNGGLFYRTGEYQASAWNDWKKLVISDLQGNIEGNMGIVGNLDLIGVATSENTSIGLTNRGIMGGNHLWRMYTSAYPGGWGLASNAFEIWEYPELANEPSNIPALRRLVIQTNRDKERCNPLIIGSEGSLNIGYGASFIATDINDLSVNGNVGIGTLNTQGYKLAVNGTIRAKEIKVESDWADFVFKKDYRLPSLEEVKSHIEEKGTLPGVPSETEVKANGISLGESNALLLQKIEELTLYTIQQQALIESLQSEVETLKSNK